MKILNYGSLNIDYTYSVDHFVRGGETMSSEEMHVFSGGKGLNQSIAPLLLRAMDWFNPLPPENTCISSEDMVSPPLTKWSTL